MESALNRILFCLSCLISTVAYSHDNEVQPWSTADCEKVSASAGAYLYVSGLVTAEADRLEKEGKLIASGKALDKALLFSELARNAAVTFSSFCNRKSILEKGESAAEN